MSTRRAPPTIAPVHLRRALLLFALVLGLTALATAVAPAPHGSDTAPVAPPPPRSAAAQVAVTFPAPAARRPPVRKVSPNASVVVQVASSGGGQATIPKLGRTATAAPDAPAQFYLAGLAPGRYDVLFAPTFGPTARVGSLVSR